VGLHERRRDEPAAEVDGLRSAVGGPDFHDPAVVDAKVSQSLGASQQGVPQDHVNHPPIISRPEPVASDGGGRPGLCQPKSFCDGQMVAQLRSGWQIQTGPPCSSSLTSSRLFSWPASRTVRQKPSSERS